MVVETKCAYKNAFVSLYTQKKYLKEYCDPEIPGFTLDAIAAAAAVANLVTITFTIVSGQYPMYRRKYYHQIKAQYASQTTASKIDAYIERNSVS